MNMEKIEKYLRDLIVEFAERPEIQIQMSEAFHIWKNDMYSVPTYFTEDDIDDKTFSKFMDWFVFDFRIFKSGKRMIEELYKEKSEDLKEDEKAVLKNWNQSCQSYFDVIKVTPSEFCVIRDIFTNEEILIHDRAASSKIKVFDIISSRLLKVGEQYFFSGIISVYPSILKDVILDCFHKEFDSYGADKKSEISVRNFLKDRAFLIESYIEDVVSHPQLISVDGKEIIVASAVYGVKSKEPILSILNQNATPIYNNSSLNKTCFYYLKDVEGVNVDANIEVGNNLTVTCHTRSRLKVVREFIERISGEFISHKNDTFKKLNLYIENSRRDTYKLPKGFRSRKKFENSLDDFYKNWIEQPLGALNGLTPSQAFKSNESRGMLESVLYELEKLYDGARKAGEPYYEVSKLRELLQIDFEKSLE